MVKKTKKGAKKGRSLDVRKPSDIRAFEDILAAGPMTIVIVYADWCGFCQRRKGEFNSLMSKAGPGMNVVKLNDEMLPKTSMASAKINGFPSAILVGPDKTPAVFKTPEGEVTNALPKSDTQTLTEIVEKANSGTMPSLPAPGSTAPISMGPFTPAPMTANRSAPTPAATIDTISENLLPSAPPDALEDMVESQKRGEQVGGRAPYRPGLFKELEAMARNGRWALGRIQKITRKLTGSRRRKGRSRRHKRN